MEECDKVMALLNKYEEASGQKANRSKTSLFFSNSVSKEVKHGIKVKLGVPEIMHYEKYLGQPSLVHPNTRKWNEELIDGLFVEEDAELIEKIPLIRVATEDTLYWPCSTSGHHTCKFGYMFLKQEAEMEASPQVPPIRDKQALMKRKITTDLICERCFSAVEETEHALWSCPELEVVWGDCEEWSFRSEVQLANMKELLSWLMAKGKSLELFAYMTWMVWNQRNKVCVNQLVVPLHQVAEQAKQMLAQFRANLQNSIVQVTDSSYGVSRWRNPQVGLVKINFDGAVFNDSNQSGIGVVIRDNNGAVLASCSKKIHQAYKPDEVETLAALKAVSFALELGFRIAILEGDALGLINALKSVVCSLSPTGLLIEDVKRVANSYVRLLYSHVKRNDNRVSHSLAKNALRIPDFQIWMEDVPSHIVSILQMDVVDSN
ncbi:uncharacterized protein LOC142634848 [Castanea sativa]|uniref:uncharacterized protein LOC142634848 n=1 Tax=Castanea sativa TaxID=21020 RepID=UPI003F64E49E